MRVKDREIVLFSVAGLVVIGMLYYFIMVGPALARQKTLTEYINRKQSEVTDMLGLRNQWDAFQKERSEAEQLIQQRGNDFTLLSYLERVSRESGIETKIRYMKPLSFAEKDEPYKLDGIEMQLEDLDIRRLMDFLFKIEHSKKLLAIERIKIRPITKGSDRVIELTLQVKTYRFREQVGGNRAPVPENAGAPMTNQGELAVVPPGPPAP